MVRASLLLAGSVLLLAACSSDAGTDAGDTSGRVTEVSVVTPDGSPVTFRPSTTDDPSSSVAQAAPTSRPPATQPSTVPVTTVAGTSPATTPATASATTVATSVVPTTAAPTTVADTSPPSTAGAPVCDIELVLAQTETTFEGITADQLACAGTWASWSGIPDDPIVTDGYFAVAEWSGVAWQLRNLGTSTICTDGGVPADLWPALGCVE